MRGQAAYTPSAIHTRSGKRAGSCDAVSSYSTEPYGTFFVNKTELIERMAERADISKAAAVRALDAAIEAVTVALCEGDTVSVVGFGTFSVGERAERTGRNPRTGTAIKIKPAKVAKFRPGKALKDALNPE
jgi:DNA-binding protein HU-beta